MTTTEEPPAGGPRRFSVQVWANTHGPKDGYTAYVPELDITVDGRTYEAAEATAIEAARQHTHDQEDPTMRPDPNPRWTCICGRNNPPGRTDCSNCGNPQL